MLNNQDKSTQFTRRAVLGGAVATLLAGCTIRGRMPAEPARLPAGLPEALPPALAATPSVVPQQAQRKPAAAVDRLTIVPRADWTDVRVGDNADPMGPIRHLTVHHTGEHLSSTGISDRELLRRIDRHHQANLGWAAIGYHRLIGSDGTVFEGRPLRWQGAHCGGDNNRNNIGISVIGEFDTALPTTAQLRTLRRLLDDMRSRYGLSARNVYGHRDWKPTTCPGDALYSWLDDYRTRTT